MKHVATPQFLSKFETLRADAAVVDRIDNVVQQVGIARDKDALLETSGLNVVPLKADVYVVRAGNARIFFTFAEGDEGTYVVFLDIADIHPSPRTLLTPSARKDPRRDSALNPKYNSAINPKSNSRLNPKFNSSINPKFNSSINPKFNSSINPKFNSSINPKYNSGINPKYNTSLNPRYNSSLNPKANAAFSGPFVYDLHLTPHAYLVRANENVSLMFSLDGKFKGPAVALSNGGFAIFDENSDWTEYFVDDGQGGYLRFTPDAEWIGIVV